MYSGLLFEQELIGAARGHQTIEPPKKQRGEGSYAWAAQAVSQAKYHKQNTLPKMGIKVTEVQPEIIEGDLVFHLDCIADYEGSSVIIDIKYTASRKDDKGKYGWGVPDALDHTQAVHYTLGSYLRDGVVRPFYYLVFGKSGWIKFIRARISSEAMENHYRIIDQVRDYMVNKFEPIPTKDCNVCADCLFNKLCDKRSYTPIEEVIEV
jgi:CRISPR/Cas system-associated exonuclease Cas4 (RecB family)